MLEEFKKFAMRGNVVDMAVGIVIGAAFGKIVSSFVERRDHAAHRPADGQCRFQQSVHQSRRGRITRRWPQPRLPGRPIIKYGVFINTVLDFVIVAFAIFMVIKAMNKMKKAEEEKRRRRLRPSRRTRSSC